MAETDIRICPKQTNKQTNEIVWKNFMDCKNNEDNKPLLVLFPKMSGFLKSHDGTNSMSHLVEDKK